MFGEPGLASTYYDEHDSQLQKLSDNYDCMAVLISGLETETGTRTRTHVHTYT